MPKYTCIFGKVLVKALRNKEISLEKIFRAFVFKTFELYKIINIHI